MPFISPAHQIQQRYHKLKQKTGRDASQPVCVLSHDKEVTDGGKRNNHDQSDRDNRNHRRDDHRAAIALLHQIAGRKLVPHGCSMLALPLLLTLQILRTFDLSLKRHSHRLLAVLQRMVAGNEVIRRNLGPFRRRMLTDFGAVRAAGMELTSLRRVRR